MAKVREFLKKNPVVGYAVAALLVAAAGVRLYTSLSGGPAPTPPTAQVQPRQPAQQPAQRPAPAPPAAPPAAPAAPPAATVPQGPTGRSDPFVPIIRGTPGRPPGGQLPPPPFLVPPGPGQLPPPPLPGQGPPGIDGGVAVTGIVGDTKSVAVVVIGGRTEIVAVGETVGGMRVLRIDAARRTVTFLQAGRRFDVAMGGE